MLNFSTLVIGEKYKAYFIQMLDSLEENCKVNNYFANVFATSEGPLVIKKYTHIKVHVSNIGININLIKFPFFIKSLAIGFAAKNIKDNDKLIHVDCDITFNNINILNKLAMFRWENH